MFTGASVSAAHVVIFQTHHRLTFSSTPVPFVSASSTCRFVTSTPSDTRIPSNALLRQKVNAPDRVEEGLTDFWNCGHVVNDWATSALRLSSAPARDIGTGLINGHEFERGELFRRRFSPFCNFSRASRRVSIDPPAHVAGADDGLDPIEHLRDRSVIESAGGRGLTSVWMSSMICEVDVLRRVRVSS